jgi:hypothetical protein
MNEFEKVLEESGRRLIEVLSWNFLGGTKETHGKMSG